MNKKKLYQDAEKIFSASLKAVEPGRLVRASLKLTRSTLSVGSSRYDLKQINRIVVIGAGKGSAAMAHEVEAILGERIDHGLVIVKYGHSVPLKKIRVLEAGHPVPDENSLQGADEILELLSGTGKKDLVICLLSGGGSALMDKFQDRITLADVQKATKLLLASGADISEINVIRKHISRIKGGWLAKVGFPSPMISLILSDVIGDDLDVIASGPTVPDHTTFTDAMELIKRYKLTHRFPKRILDYLRQGVQGKAPETPKKKEAVFKTVLNQIIGNNQIAVDGAASQARKLGYHTLILTTSIQGEAREAATFLSSIAREVAQFDRPVKRPACIIAGGETTVTLEGKGKGGRNQEMVLAAALDIRECKHVLFLSGGTDGTDGPTDAAGAMVDDTTFMRATKNSVNIRAFLEKNDSYRFFKKMGGHLITGPTLTNVMDVVVILVV